MRYAIILLLLSVIFGSINCTSEAEKLASLDSTIDLGTVEARDSLDYTLYVRNDFGEALLIEEVKASCRCIVAAWDKQSIERGDSAAVDLVLDLAGRTGPFSESVVIRTNQPSPFLARTITGTIRDSLQVTTEG